MDIDYIVENLRPVLYVLAFIEAIYFLYSREYPFLFIVSIIPLLLLSIRQYVVLEPDERWVSIREFLHMLLSNNQLLLPSPVIEESLDLSEQETQSIISVENSEFLDQLRTIGTDGLLILLFLIRNSQALCSAKQIQLDLAIPKSTLYRQINALQEDGYIKTKQLLDQPKTSLFQITAIGESLIIDLHLHRRHSTDALHKCIIVKEPIRNVHTKIGYEQ